MHITPHICTHTDVVREGWRTFQGKHKLRQVMTTDLAPQKVLTGILYTEEEGRDSVMKGQE